jgi:cold shock CspA family protein
MSHAARQLTKIGVFYDGNYFDRVGKYYCHQHEKRAWISIPGLHDYIRYRVADSESVDMRHCQVIDAHYFRGRFSAQKTKEKGDSAFYNDRALDDILMRENVMAHYLPMNFVGKEKGVDVWLALEAFELTIYKKFDVVVLIASDSDYIPLVRKLKTLGTRVMALNWFISYEGEDGYSRETRPSQMLLREVNYPVIMSEVIDEMDKTKGEERDVLSGLFQRRRNQSPRTGAAEAAWKIGFIEALYEHFGFIRPEGFGKNVYFRYVTLDDASPDELEKGMEVSFLAGPETPKGPSAAKVRMTSAS